MKKYLSALAALSLLFACTPEENGADNNQSGNGVDKIVHVTGISLDRNSATIKEGESITLVVTVTPANADNKEVNWSSSSDAVATVDASGKVTARTNGNATIKATANDGSGVFASCSVEVYRIDVPQAVNMGTVVNGKNIKWASFNIGASSPEEYGGLYYAWGETEPKENFSSWSTYKFRTSSSGPFSKYNTIDNKTVLEPEDDVASVKLGGKWRMPTYAEWTELMTKCTWTWTTNYNGTGVRGRIVTASNGNSIFLPAAGGWYANLNGVGSYGCYWSSSLNTYYPNLACYVDFGDGCVSSDFRDRFHGMSVRPVSE